MSVTDPDNVGLAVLTIATALGCGLAAGVFFAFSSFVMSGLARLPPAQGIAAMQSINVTAVRPLFMSALFGTAAACLPLLVIGIRDRGEWPGLLLLVGSAFYLVGAIGLTAGYHVPRNNALMTLDPGEEEAALRWRVYLAEWTRWNHVRTLSSLAAALALTIAAAELVR
jgi:uncharacterized membrane protein